MFVLVLLACIFTTTTCYTPDLVSNRMGPAIDFGIPSGSYKSLLKNKEGKKPRLTELTYENCGSPDDPGRLLNLRLSPTNDGDVIVTAAAETDLDLISPIRVKLNIKKHVMGVWVNVPCFHHVGSCDFKDFCQFGSRDCPLPFLIENNLPCRCPVRRGLYSVSMAPFQIPRFKTAGLVAGDYRGKVEVFILGKRLACYNGTFSVDISPFS